jgi:hypothetical protein
VNVRIRDIALQMRMVDGESLLTPALLERISAAVAEQLRGERQEEQTRRRDVHIGPESCGGGCGGGGGHADT